MAKNIDYWHERIGTTEFKESCKHNEEIYGSDTDKSYVPWFAWHPVVTETGFKWLTMVGRRWSTDGPSSEFHCWEHTNLK